jgi:glutamate-1-semialdehyde 2,1-aminomutase
MAAAVATLRILGDPSTGVYDTLERVGGRLLTGLQEIGRARGTNLLAQGLPMVFSTSFSPLQQTFDAADASRADAAAHRRLAELLVRRGVRITARGSWWVSAAHTDDDVDRTLDAFDAALAEHAA